MAVWLESVLLPNNVENVGEAAFAESGIKSVTIPASVTEIGELCFSESTVTWIAE